MDVLRAIELYRVTHLLTTPSMMALLLRHMDHQKSANLDGYNRCNSPGALFQPSLLAEIETRFDAE